MPPHRSNHLAAFTDFRQRTSFAGSTLSATSPLRTLRGSCHYRLALPASAGPTRSENERVRVGAGAGELAGPLELLPLGAVLSGRRSPYGHGNANRVDATNWFDLALHLGLRSCRVDRRVRYRISEGRQGRYQGQDSQSRARARWRVTSRRYKHAQAEST